jgi:hypothetical protein
MRTKDECKRLLSKIGLKIGVSPILISTRLLSDEDKKDMLNGDLSLEILELHVKMWMANGMPDYAHGNTDYFRNQ